MHRGCDGRALRRQRHALPAVHLPPTRLMRPAAALWHAFVGACGFTVEGVVPPYSGTPGLFDQSKPDLGLQPAPGLETASIFKPSANPAKFNHGVVLLPF